MLCASLTYEQGLPEVLSGEEVQQFTKRYAPPFDEFEVQRVELPAGESTLLPANPVRTRDRGLCAWAAVPERMLPSGEAVPSTASCPKLGPLTLAA